MPKVPTPEKPNLAVEFVRSVPAMLTALATLVVAITGLVALLVR